MKKNKWFSKIIFIVCLVMLVTSMQASVLAEGGSGASITLSTYNVKTPDDSFNVTISGATNPTGDKDWIGLYEADSTPGGSNPAIWWAYAVDLGISNGNGTFTFDPNSTGHMEQRHRYVIGKEYKFILMKDDGYDIEAVSENLSLNDIRPSISLSSSKIKGKQTKFSVTVRNAQTRPADKVAIYEADAVPGEMNAVWWSFITDAGITGETGTFEFDPDKVQKPDLYNEGRKYKFVLMDNTSKIVKASAEFVVQNEGSPLITLSSNEVNDTKTTLDVTVTNSQNPSEQGDWIGLYEADSAPGDTTTAVWWAYLADLGITGGKGGFTFDPAKVFYPNQYKEGKTYKFYLMYNDTYNVEASALFEVKPKISVKAEVDNSTGVVNISGQISTGAGKQITVKIVNQNGDIIYIDQINSLQDGNFDFKTSIAGSQGGKYTVKLRGKDMEQVISKEFAYSPKNEPSVTPGNSGTSVEVPAKDMEVTLTKDGIAKGGIKPSINDGKAVVDVKQEYLDALFKKTGENAEGKKVILEVLEDKESKAYAVELPIRALSSDKNNKIEVRTSTFSFEISDRMLKEMGKSDAATAVIQVTEAEKDRIDSGLMKKIGSRPVVNLLVTVGGKAIKWNDEAPVSISVKYAPQASEAKSPGFIVVWNIEENNKINVIPNGKYNSEKGLVQFKAVSSGTFAIGYERKTFSDLNKSEWARKYIEVMASKGIVQGRPDGTFAPNESIRRAEFLKYLINALNLSAGFDSNFSDVKPDEDYYKAVGTAKKLGIVSGTGNGFFRPDTVISRQDMMVMTDKALKAAKVKLDTSGTGIDRFRDKEEIASYAKESMERLVKAGIISGNNGKVNPKGTTTKAEAAAIVYALYNMIEE